MPENLPVTIVPATIPSGVCFSSEQERLNYFASKLSGTVPGQYNTYNYGDSEPAAVDRVKPWFRPSDGRWYNYTNGFWVAWHSVQDTNTIRIYTGTLANLTTYDGGDSGAIGDASGPMWEEATEFRGRSPLGVGTLPSTSTSVALLANYGEATHMQTVEEVGPHGHSMSHPRVEGSGSGDIVGNDIVAGDIGTGPQSGTLSANINTYASGQVAFNVVHPVVGVYFVRRTARKYYRAL